MRENKYRAWDGVYMHDVGQIIFHNSHSNPFTVFGESNNIIEDPELMQFTGLHDSNGVEIYEGDIVSANYTEPLIVSFNNNNYSELMGWNLLNKNNNAYSYYYGLSPDASFTVIGNIYEHRDLLKG